MSKKDIRKLIEKVNNYMQGLAQRTGGRSYQIDYIADLKKTFETVSLELGRQYSLGYYSKKQSEAGQKRQIKVKVRRPNLVVLARDSYVVQPLKNK